MMLLYHKNFSSLVVLDTDNSHLKLFVCTFIIASTVDSCIVSHVFWVAQVDPILAFDK